MQDDHPERSAPSDVIAGLCASFAARCGTGEQPRIEEFLAEVSGPQRDLLLARLLSIEIDFLRQQGREPSTADYLIRFPEYRGLIDSVLSETILNSRQQDSTVEHPTSLTPVDDGDFVVVGNPARSHAPSGSRSDGDRYARQSLLGRGAFAEVWRAHDSRMRRDVALKIPRTDKLFPPELYERFLAEARRMAALDNIPGIVRVIDVAPAAEDFYIVMQFVDGETLAARLSDTTRPRLTHRETAQLIADLATALDEVHRHNDNITHRDLKPQNILLDRKGRPYITDFGLAVTESEQLVEPPTQQGTKAYLSPEQARFESNLVDGRSDIFALGVMLYEMLCGVRPFQGQTPEDLVRAILHSEPRPLRARDGTIPKTLEDICLKCLEKRQGDRYRTAGDLAAALRSWLTGETPSSVEPPPPPPHPVTGTPPHSNVRERLALLATGATLLGLAVTAFLLIPGRLPKDESPPPDEPPVPAVAAAPVWHNVGQTYRMLDHDPEPVLWVKSFADARKAFDPDRQELMMNCSYPGVLSAGICNSEDFRVEVQIAKTAWVGHSGVVWGITESQDGDGQLRVTCQCLNIYGFVENGTVIHRFERSLLEISHPPDVFAPALNPRVFLSVRTEPPPTAEARLEFEVRAGHLRQVLWAGKSLTGLNDGPDVSVPDSLPVTGKVGFYNGGGTSIFREARMTLLESITAPLEGNSEP